MTFDEFWSLYPRKTAKKAAVRAWEKLNPDLFLWEDIRSDLLTRKWPEPKFIPHPATYLNGERWTDEAPREIGFIEKHTDKSWRDGL